MSESSKPGEEPEFKCRCRCQPGCGCCKPDFCGCWDGAPDPDFEDMAPMHFEEEEDVVEE